jgi:hypothetical protein
VQHQIAVGIKKNLHAAAAQPKFLGNPHGLAVAVHEDSTDGCWHGKSLRTHVYVCILQSGLKNSWADSPEVH